VKDSIRKRLARAKRRIERRLEGPASNGGRPMFAAGNVCYELADRVRGIAVGGIGVMHRLAEECGLVEAIDRRVDVLKIHLPYHESDHVLNLAYNVLCGGVRMEDIELRRNDEVFLDALGTARIPDPTTAGDFCRRFTERDIRDLMEAVDDARLAVWSRQPGAFLRRATIDCDGVLVGTTGECKQDMDISYKGTWGYHPLIVSLAETGEVLRLVNRPGNRPSHEGAAAELDGSIALCRRAGFRKIVLRGDTAFSQSERLDGWDADGVTFYFGFKAMHNLQEIADNLPKTAWKKLVRPPRYQVRTEPRQRPQNVKQQVVRRREFDVLRLKSEEVAEFDYRPAECQKTYRMVVVRKNISHEKGEARLFDEVRYFFYITNDRRSSPEEVVFEANHRCDQENLIAQLTGGVRALSAPVDNLLSNWAFMLMTALAWNLKAWFALWLPEQKRWKNKHHHEKHEVLRMEFRTFVNAFIKLPCQIVRAGRRLVYRVMAYRPSLSALFRLCVALRC
jgi:Transposase DDE domain group 1